MLLFKPLLAFWSCKNTVVQSLNFKYFLTGKVQTDMLEDRFGKFRQLAGGQYIFLYGNSMK